MAVLDKQGRDVNEFLDDWQREHDITLTLEQKLYIIDVVDGSSHVANWSDAGTGKSLCLEIIKEFLGDKLIICATTGIANSLLFNLQGGDGTAHKIFSLSIGMYNARHEKEVYPATQALFAKSDLVQYVVVEEAGMLTADALSLIDKRIKRYNRPYGKKRKARQIKLILQGDILQVDAVKSDMEKQYMINKYGSHYMFNSTIYEHMDFSFHNFTESKRTSDKTFQACHKVMRYGVEARYPKCLAWMNKRYGLSIPDNIPVIATTNKKVDQFNKIALEANPNPVWDYHVKVTGKYEVKNCPVDAELELKVGMPVITIVNHPEGDYSNGSFGHVTDCEDTGVWVKFQATGETYFIGEHEFDESESYTSTERDGAGNDVEVLLQKSIGKAYGIPVKVAAAFSVFRVQGRTLDVPAVIDLGYYGFPTEEDNDWGVAQAYVAWTRFTRPDLVYLKNKMLPEHIKVNRTAIVWLRQQQALLNKSREGLVENQQGLTAP